MDLPAASAPFPEKLAYYQSQHTSKGVRATHLIGTPIIMPAMPLLFARPRVGLPLFVGGWGLQIFGHKAFEHNNPALKHGPVTYQLAGVVHVCEQFGEMLARRSQRKAQHAGAEMDAHAHTAPDRHGEEVLDGA